jgi:hypothetical protein
MRHPMLLVVVILLLCAVAMPAAGQDERTPASRLRALKAERLAARPQAAPAAIGAKTVVVNCAKGDSISAALAKNTGPLVIELRGTCRENVLIERSDVTLRGADPASDGIQGVTAVPQPDAALALYYANRIRLENLFVADSPRAGVGAWYSVLQMLNCRIARNGGTGIHISLSSLDGTELVVSENAGAGINSQRVGRVICLGCRLVDNAPAAISRTGSFMTLWDTEVSGKQGIRALDGGSYIDVDCVTAVSTYPCSVNVQGYAARAFSGGQAALWGVGAFNGAVHALDGGLVGVYSSQQTLPVGFTNQVSESARLTTGTIEVGDAATILATTHLGIFARASLFNATELAGNLTCDSGADAWSDTPYPAAKVGTCKTVPTTP